MCDTVCRPTITVKSIAMMAVLGCGPMSKALLAVYKEPFVPFARIVEGMGVAAQQRQGKQQGVFHGRRVSRPHAGSVNTERVGWRVFTRTP